MKNTAVCDLFAKRARQSALPVENYSAYSLRHAFAMRLLERGVGVKAIGAVANREAPKVADLDTAPAGEMPDHVLEHRLDRDLDVPAQKRLAPPRQAGDELRSGHDGVPMCYVSLLRRSDLRSILPACVVIHLRVASKPSLQPPEPEVRDRVAC